MSVTRPIFRERQVLRAADLTAEQAARIGRRARHARAAHVAGVASGLSLRVTGDRVEAAPGAALLPSGDVLCVTEPLRAAIPAADGVYPVSLRQRSRAGRRSVARSPVLDLSQTGADSIALGTVHRSLGALSVDDTARQRIGLRADRIVSPDGSAELGLGPGPNSPEPELSVAFGTAPVLRVTGRRGARADGALHLRRGPAGSGATIRDLLFERAVPPPDGPAPWSLRRVAGEVDGRPVDDLRLELRHPGKTGDPARQRLWIGGAGDGLALDAEGTLTLLSGGNRAAAGIRVPPPGQVAFAPVSPGPADAAFAAALTQSMLKGLAVALMLATLQTGIAGVVLVNGVPAEGIAVRREGGETVTDAEGRFYLGAAGWPGETVILEFEGDDGVLGSAAATVGPPATTFAFIVDGFDGDII